MMNALASPEQLEKALCMLSKQCSEKLAHRHLLHAMARLYQTSLE
jgi:hypothetical protein